MLPSKKNFHPVVSGFRKCPKIHGAEYSIKKTQFLKFRLVEHIHRIEKLSQ